MHNTNVKTPARNSGYITLMSVLVVGAVGVIIATSLLLLGISSARSSFAGVQSNQALGLADACVEEGLEQIRELTSYTGTGNLSLGQGSCTYTVTSQGGNNRTIQASSTVGTLVRKVNVVITAINPLITVSTWQEVADF